VWGMQEAETKSKLVAFQAFWTGGGQGHQVSCLILFCHRNLIDDLHGDSATKHSPVGIVRGGIHHLSANTKHRTRGVLHLSY
jgi:hypothetical protein